MSVIVPNFLYVGTSKAGSTWLFNSLAVHPQVFLANDKGVYYFDHNYAKGKDWYLDQFAECGDADAVGEISHSYLSSPEAPRRIFALNPQIRLLACLREPVDRAFSDYLDLVKNGQYSGPFEEALDHFPRLLDRGHYATHLRRYIDVFGRDQLRIQLFDDLKADAQAYADTVFDFLGVDRLRLTPTDLRPRMQAGTARNAMIADVAKKASRLVLGLGLRRLRSRIKRSTAVRNALYRPYGQADRPVLDAETRARLRGRFATEIAALDELLDAPVSARWGYVSP